MPRLPMRREAILELLVLPLHPAEHEMLTDVLRPMTPACATCGGNQFSSFCAKRETAERKEKGPSRRLRERLIWSKMISSSKPSDLADQSCSRQTRMELPVSAVGFMSTNRYRTAAPPGAAQPPFKQDTTTDMMKTPFLLQPRVPADLYGILFLHSVFKVTCFCQRLHTFSHVFLLSAGISTQGSQFSQASGLSARQPRWRPLRERGVLFFECPVRILLRSCILLLLHSTTREMLCGLNILSQPD